jgi:hypothetical protein
MNRPDRCIYCGRQDVSFQISSFAERCVNPDCDFYTGGEPKFLKKIDIEQLEDYNKNMSRPTTLEELIAAEGDFSWNYGNEFFIETKFGNYIWSDPDYSGNHTIRRFSGSCKEYTKSCNIPFLRDKGKHIIKDYIENVEKLFVVGDL